MAKLFDAAVVKASLDDTRLKSLRQTYGKGGGKGYAFQFVKTSKLGEGTYRIRFLPPFPGLAKRIPVRLVTHGVEIKQGAKPMYVHCNGKTCLLCRLLEVMEPRKDELSDPKQQALGHLNPWERFNIPIAVGAQPDPNDQNKYPVWVPDKSVEKGIILVVEAAGILKKINGLMEKYPDLSDIEDGRYLKLQKEGKNSYEFSEPGAPKPLATQDLYTADKYPKLDELALSAAKKMDNDDVLELLQGVWWRKTVPFGDLDESGVGGDEPDEDEEVAEVADVDDDDEPTPPKSGNPKYAATKAAKPAAKKRVIDEDDEDETPWGDDD